MSNSLVFFAVLGACAFCLLTPASMQAHQREQTSCEQWIRRIDPRLGEAGIQVDFKRISDAEVIDGIQCLFRLKGEKLPARFSGATSPSVSQIFPPATIELAALYYISHLFQRRWRHADGVALWNVEGTINPPGAIETAYAAYEKWFERVRAIGLSAARRKHMDPLKGTGLSWYGT